MIISRTPYRISFFGGGTDYPAWYRRHGGAVLGATINKYSYLSCRYLPPFFEHRTRIVYRQIENVKTVDEIAHPAVREVLRYLGMTRGVEIHHDGDLPARSGVGSSSAFTVGLMNALYALKGVIPTRERLAQESIFIEQHILKEHVGCQDQVLAAYGGVNHIDFAPGGEIQVRPITLKPDRLKLLNSHLMLFFTGLHRTASDVAATYTASLVDKEPEMKAIAAMVPEALAILTSERSLNDFGRLLDEGWRAKRSLSATVTNGRIEEIYREARCAGAIGGKLIGAGGGGFMLLFAPPEAHAQVRDRLRALTYVPFTFEFRGSQVIFFDPEEDLSEEERQRDVSARGVLATVADNGVEYV
ncbi:MAG: kinase [Acidobacteria bacterium]|nr:kinase [Acidobacteriota bacterium]